MSTLQKKYVLKMTDKQKINTVCITIGTKDFIVTILLTILQLNALQFNVECPIKTLIKKLLFV